MPSFKVAHITEQGQDMLLFPLDASFGLKGPVIQDKALAELQARAHGAGLSGRAVAVWEEGNKTMSIGPEPWKAFLASLSMRFVLKHVNKTISW
jgi:hypothetical protein